LTVYYLDASALVKRYARETGSDWIVEITDLAAEHTIIFSELTLPEVAATFAAKQRSPHEFSLRARDRALSHFLQDCVESFMLLHIDRDVIELAVDLTQSHRLRGYDSTEKSLTYRRARKERKEKIKNIKVNSVFY
jgi:hypothetical protein